MKKIFLTLLVITAFAGALSLQSCAPTKAISEKSGAQLWGENCNRCHNAPSMDQYTKDQWDIIGTHMRVRALITDDEAKKIIAFLQGQN